LLGVRVGKLRYFLNGATSQEMLRGKTKIPPFFYGSKRNATLGQTKKYKNLKYLFEIPGNREMKNGVIMLDNEKLNSTFW
jgi:hypothetical protein